MKKSGIKSLVEISLFVAIISVLSQISLPIGLVPITIQVFAICIMSYFLGLKRGLVAIIVYIFLGVVGIPVFAGFRGGFHIIISYTGGFIFGFVPLTILCGINSTRKVGIVFGIIGVIICHLMGVIQYSVLGEVSLLNSFLIVSLPFLLKDILLVPLAFIVANRINKALQK